MSEVTKRLATDLTLQSINTTANSLAKDSTLGATNTALGLLGKDTTLTAIKNAIQALPNATQAAADAATAAAALANEAVANIGDEISGAIGSVKNQQLRLVPYTLLGGALNVATGEYNTELVIYGHLEYTLSGEKTLIVSGYNFGSNYRGWAVFNEDGEIIETMKAGYPDSSPFSECIVLPEGASKIVVNVRKGTPQSDAAVYSMFIGTYADGVGVSTDIKTELRDMGGSIVYGKAYRATKKESEPDENNVYKTIALSGGEELIISGVHITRNFPAFMFFDANNDVIYLPLEANDQDTHLLPVRNQKINAPVSARKVIVNGRLDLHIIPVIRKVYNAQKTLFDNISADETDSKINYASIYPTLVSGKVKNKDGVTESSGDNYMYCYAPVTGGQTYYITGRHLTINWPLYVFVDGNGNPCGVPQPGELEGTGYTHYKVVAPLDATRLYVNSLIARDYDIAVAKNETLGNALLEMQAANVYTPRTAIASITNDLVDGTWTQNASKAERNLSKFGFAYATMLHRIMTTYPAARVICCTCNECERTQSIGLGVPETNNAGETIYDYNKMIKTVADVFGAIVVDHHACGITYYNLEATMEDFASSTGFGLHPNAYGMSLIAECTIAALKDFDLAGKTFTMFGDSISTFNGTGSEYNTYPVADVDNVNKTWWYKSFVTGLGMTLLKNASGGGRSVSTIREGVLAGRPKSGCNQDAIDSIALNGTAPDVIVIKLGINDFGNVGSGNNLDLQGNYQYGGI